MSVDATAVARVLGISVEFVDARGDRAVNLPQRIAVFAQGSIASTYSLTKRRIRSATEGGQRYGFGSPIHLILRELFPENGDGVGTIPVTVYPLDAEVYDAGAPSVGRITPTGTATKKSAYRVRIAGILSQAFTVLTTDNAGAIVGKIVTAVNAVLEMPVIAANQTTYVSLTSKWAGESANDIVIEAAHDDNDDDLERVLGKRNGLTFTLVQPTGGLTNPSVASALGQVGNVWETMALNAMNSDDDTTLDAFQEFGEGRWDPLVRRPLVVFVGETTTSANTATAITDARKDDRVNAMLVAPGSPNLPCVVAARQLARIARVANNNPPTDYGAERIDRIIAGDDGDQWDYTTRDSVVKLGCSTVDVVDKVVSIGDVVTMYHPQGEEPPAFRYVVDIVRLQNSIFNYDLVFGAKEWAAAPLIPDGQATDNALAKQPNQAITEAGFVTQGLADAAIISDPETTKKNTTAAIDSQNPKQLNIKIPLSLSGNTNKKNVELTFSFFFGG